MGVAYYDTGGSGIETVAHLRENGRITLMFGALDGPPKIVRFYGKGRSVTPQDVEFDGLLALFTDIHRSCHGKVRSIIVIDVELMRQSCGFGVPLMSFEGYRDTLPKTFE